MKKFAVFSILILQMTVKVFPSDKIGKNKLCESWKSVILDNKLKDADGFIIDNGIKYSENETFTTNKKRGCPCINNPCIRKCCSKDKLYISNRNGHYECRNNSYGIDVIEEVANNGIMQNFSINSTVIVSHELQYNCKSGIFFANQDFEVISNGSLLYKNDYYIVTIDDYCFEYVRVGRHLKNNVKNGTYFFMCNEPITETEIIQPNIRAIKSQEKEDELLAEYYKRVQLKYYPFFMIISLPFLVVTFVIYTFVSDLNNLVGKCLASMTVSLAVMCNLLPSVMWLGPDALGRVCKPVAYLTEYTILSSFCWLNVMCFDIWAVFSGVSVPHRKLSKRDEIKKYLKYAAYAWSTPLIMCGLIYAVDEWIILDKNSKFKPGMGVSFCLLDNNYSKVIFFYFPLTIILIVNITFFSITMAKIKEQKSQTEFLSTHGNKVNRVEKERFNLYFKLFLVMGLTWVGEPLSRIFDNLHLFWLWFFVDALNLLQGIPIFIIFVCKRRTLRILNTKFHPSIRYFSSVRTSISSRRESNVDSPQVEESTLC